MLKIPHYSTINYESIKVEPKPKKDYAGTGAVIFTFTVMSIVIALSIYTAWQIAYGETNSRVMVDKLIQDTKTNKATNQAYKTELLKRMENNTCLYQYTESSGLQKLGKESSITQLEDALKNCVAEGTIKKMNNNKNNL